MRDGCYLYVADKASWEESVTAQQRTSLTLDLIQYYMTREIEMGGRYCTTAVAAILQILATDAEAATRMDVYKCWDIFAEYLPTISSAALRSESPNNTMDLCLAFLNDRELREHPKMTASGVRYVLRRFQCKVRAANSSGAKSDSTQQDLDEFNTKYDKAQTILATDWKKGNSEAREKENSKARKWPGFTFVLLMILSSLLLLSYNLSSNSPGGPGTIRDL